MNKIKIFIFFVFLSGLCYSQQDSQYTQYMYNTNVINPAYAGSRETTSFFVLHRNQWVGVSGAPVTNNISGSFLAFPSFGVGVDVVDDRVGPVSRSDFAVDMAYSIALFEEKISVGFGIKASANLFNVDFTMLTAENPDEFLAIDKKLSPNVGIGLYARSSAGYFGFSIPRLFETKHFASSDGGQTVTPYIDAIHAYVIGGYVLTLSENLLFKPSVLGSYVQGSPFDVNISANFLIGQKFILGAAYRVNSSVSGLVGFQPTRNWLIGYSYDYDLTDISKISSGSHEIFLRFELFKSETYNVSPRFF